MKRKYTRFKETPKRYECTKRKCKWQGTYEEKDEIQVTSSMWEKVCPNCGNNEFRGLLE